MNKNLKLIAIGIANTNDARKQRVERMNYEIDAIYDSIHSSCDTDGLPRSTDVGDPVGSRSVKAERLIAERDAEQTRLDAVEWARRYVRDMYCNESVCDAVDLLMRRKESEAYCLAELNTINKWTVRSAKETFIKQILLYLHLFEP